MRFDQRTVILLIVSLVVIVAVLLISNPASAPGLTPTPVEQTAPVFGELDQTTITGITITNNDTGETTVLAKDAANVWTVGEATNSADRATDQDAVTTALGTFTALASSENFTTENLADFGLDSPAYTLVMTAADGTTYTLLVGNKAPANPRYYALVNDDTSTVYVVQQTQVNQLTNLIATPPYVPPPTATATYTPSPNPYSEVEQTATAVVEQTATTGALFAQMTAEATGEVTAEAEAATEEATEEAGAEITEEATVVMQAEPTEVPTVEETEEVTEEATEEASPAPTRTPAPTRPPTSTPTATESPTPTETPVPLPTSIAVDSERRYGRIPQDVSEEGFPQLGEPDAAVQITLYGSFDSPDSRAFHLDVLLNLIDRVRSGQIRVTFVPLYGTGSISNGERAAQAAVCAAQQGAFWHMSDILFERQGTLRNQAFTSASLADAAASAGVDETEWQECLDSDLPGEVLDAAQASAEAQSIDDTPTVLVEGEPVDADLNSINAAVDTAMQGS